jgi:hypothetical protein
MAMGNAEDQKRYGWCKRTGAWVPRDEMLGLHVQIFDATGGKERFTIRLHPEAHRVFTDELRGLEWENVLRTHAELVAEGAPIAEVKVGMTDTAAWYGTRRLESEDEILVARALLRPALRARSFADLEEYLRRVSERVGGEALCEAVRGSVGKFPRWDDGIVDIGEYTRSGSLYSDVAFSADEAEILILRIQNDGDVKVLRADHDRGEAVMRARGRLPEDPASLTR